MKKFLFFLFLIFCIAYSVTAEESKILESQFEIVKPLKGIYIAEGYDMLEMSDPVFITIGQSIADSTKFAYVQIVSSKKVLYQKSYKDVTIVRSRSEKEEYKGNYGYAILNDEYILTLCTYNPQLDGFVVVLYGIEL